jgi:hypothetical protein
MVDEIDEGRSYRASPVKVDQVGAVHLKSQESAPDQVGEGVGRIATYRTEIGYALRGVTHWSEET